MNTKDIMNIALKLAGITEIPEDSDINVPCEDVKRVLAGVDIDSAEILAASMKGYDCILRHHPRGYRMANVGEMEVRDHMKMMVDNGVPANIAQKLAAPRKQRMNRSMHMLNLVGQVQFAEFLGMGYLSIHTPADLIFENALKERMKKLEAEKDEAKEAVTCGDIIENLLEIPELSKTPIKPEIWIGNEDSFAGKIMVTMAGGGAPTVEEFLACVNAGVGTILTMHIEREEIAELEKDGRCNVIVTGHIPSDAYGINRITEELEKQGVEVARIGGLVY